MNYMSRLGQYTSSVRTWPPDFSVFFQDEGKSIKRGENHHKSAHVESCSYSKGEWVGSVVRGRKCSDVSYATGVVVFITTYFHKLIHQLRTNRLSSHGKLPFKSTNIRCVFESTSQTGSKNNFPFPVDHCSYFSVLSSNGVHWKGRDLGTVLI